MSFQDLGLNPEILRAITEQGYTDPTPIQAKAIPIVLAGHDVMGGAQTGTGKTASFTLPLLQRLARHASSSPSPAKHPVRALILAPTRELAMQVFESVKVYSRYVPLRASCIYGGTDIKPQIAELREGREIIVATPGRLLDHVEQKTVNFNQVEMLVLDEADRMLDMGFIPDIKRILALLPRERQSLLFSATFSDEIKKLADTMLRAPQLVEVAKRNMVSETVTHRLLQVEADGKREMLAGLLLSRPDEAVLVFVATKFGASRLAHFLTRQGISADAIHGDKSQSQRTEALCAFKEGRVRVLVATDVAARGLDIDDLPHVINFDLPHTAEDYVHRIGRTGRAGKSGSATSLVAPEEKLRLADIEKLIKQKIEVIAAPAAPAAPAAEPRRRESSGRESGGRESGGRERSGRESSGRESSGRESSGRESDNRGRPARVTSRSHQAAPKPGEFDWSKPYEPSAEKTAEGEVAEKPKSPTLSKSRVVAALLGGLPKRT